jgi:hypothetical protein
MVAGAIMSYTDPYLAAESPQPHVPFHQEVTKFSFRQFGAFGLVTRLQADSLSVVPRRFLFFNIKSVNEVHLLNAHIETHMYAHDTDGTTLFPTGLGQSIGGGRGGKAGGQYGEFGLITRVLVRGVTVELFEADRLALVLRADEGYVDHKNKEPSFSHAVLKNPSATRRIVSERIIWDPRSRVFKIPGAYVVLTEKGESRGKGVKVDIDFTVSPL